VPRHIVAVHGWRGCSGFLFATAAGAARGLHQGAQDGGLLVDGIQLALEVLEEGRVLAVQVGAGGGGGRAMDATVCAAHTGEGRGVPVKRLRR